MNGINGEKYAEKFKFSVYFVGYCFYINIWGRIWLHMAFFRSFNWNCYNMLNILNFINGNYINIGELKTRNPQRVAMWTIKSGSFFFSTDSSNADVFFISHIDFGTLFLQFVELISSFRNCFKFKPEKTNERGRKEKSIENW